MSATLQHALCESALARVHLLEHITKAVVCVLATVCSTTKALAAIGRGLQTSVRPWICAAEREIRWVTRLRRRYIMAEILRRISGNVLPYDTYATDEEEERYWKEAERGLRELQRSDARYVEQKTKRRHKQPNHTPLVTYYTPALPPNQPTKEERHRTPLSYKQEMRYRSRVTPEIYMKWYWMTVPDGVRLPEEIARQRIEDASAEELREIYRLSKTLPDDHEVFRCTDLRVKKEIMKTYNWRHYFSWYGAFKRREEDEAEGQFVFDRQAMWLRAANDCGDDDDDEGDELDAIGRRSSPTALGVNNYFDYGDDLSDSESDSSSEEPRTLSYPGDALSSAGAAFIVKPADGLSSSINISDKLIEILEDDDGDYGDSDESTADETEEDLEKQFANWSFSNVSVC